jgi:pimeloyl-ACP methyl ester carboxylesterase
VKEAFVEVDGFRIRYLEFGQGAPLVHLHGAGGQRVSRAHQLLGERRRVLLFEMPGFGFSEPNERTRTTQELAGTMAAAATALGLERFDLMGNSFGAKVALWLALQSPERVSSLVLVAPAAIRLREHSPEEIQAGLFVHPENRPPGPAPDPAALARMHALSRRLIGPPRDAELEGRLQEVEAPVLVVMGTADLLIPPELGRHYVELLPNAFLVFLYDAAHAADGDRPEAFAALVDDFLERKQEFLVTNRSGALLP